MTKVDDDGLLPTTWRYSPLRPRVPFREPRTQHYIARLAPRYERSGPYHSEQEARTWAQRYNANNTDHPTRQAP